MGYFTHVVRSTACYSYILLTSAIGWVPQTLVC